MHMHFSAIGSGWIAGGFAAVATALALAIALCASGLRGPYWPRHRVALGLIAILAGMLAGFLAAERVAADLIDLSESAARELTLNLRLLIGVVGGLAIAAGLVATVVFTRLPAAKAQQARRLAGLVLGFAGVLASFFLLQGIGRNAGMDPRACAISILIGVALAWHSARRYTSPTTWVIATASLLLVASMLLLLLTNAPSVLVWCCIALSVITVAGCSLINPADITQSDVPAERDSASTRWHPLQLAGAAALLALLPAALQLGHLGLERHARAWIAHNAPTPPTDAPLYAVCIRPETFAVVVPAMGKDGQDLIRAAVLADRSQFASPTDLDHLEVGTIIPAKPLGGDLDAKRFQLKARVAHGDHYHDYDFAVVNTAKAEPRELASALHAHAASPALLGGIILGVLCSLVLMRLGAGVPSFLIMFIALAMAVLGGPGTSVGIILGLMPVLLRPTSSGR